MSLREKRIRARRRRWRGWRRYPFLVAEIMAAVAKADRRVKDAMRARPCRDCGHPRKDHLVEYHALPPGVIGLSWSSTCPRGVAKVDHGPGWGQPFDPVD